MTLGGKRVPVVSSPRVGPKALYVTILLTISPRAVISEVVGRGGMNTCNNSRIIKSLRYFSNFSKVQNRVQVVALSSSRIGSARAAALMTDLQEFL